MKTQNKRKGIGPKCLGSPMKIAPILGMIAKKVLISKAVDKLGKK